MRHTRTNLIEATRPWDDRPPSALSSSEIVERIERLKVDLMPERDAFYTAVRERDRADYESRFGRNSYPMGDR